MLTPTVWLDASLDRQENDASFHDVTLSLDDDYRSTDVFDDLHTEKINKFLYEALEVLDKRERFIIERYYGLTKDDSLNLEQIGKVLGRTRERIRQVRDVALSKIKKEMQHVTQEVYA